MNIIKGMDRIALIIAIIAVVPGLVIGGFITYDVLKTVTPEYKAWEKENPYDIKVGRIRAFGSKSRSMPKKYQDQPLWQLIIGGLIFAPLFSMAVLFGTRLASRGIRVLSLWIIKVFKWIIEGFKDEENNKNE